MTLVIALTMWALVSVPIAIALGRLCGGTGKPKNRTSRSGNSADDGPGKRLTV